MQEPVLSELEKDTFLVILISSISYIGRVKRIFLVNAKPGALQILRLIFFWLESVMILCFETYKNILLFEYKNSGQVPYTALKNQL